MGTVAATVALVGVVAFGVPALISGGHRAPLWAAYDIAPKSRTVAPVSARVLRGDVSGAGHLGSGRGLQLSGRSAEVVVDFGKEVAGWVTLRFGSATPGQRVGLAFTESPLYIGTNSDATDGVGASVSTDGSLTATVQPNGEYTMPPDKVRLGFRYLTLFMQKGGTVAIRSVRLDFSAVPTMPDPADYGGNYFWSNDTLLDRIWYAGAYTVEMDTIPPDHGRQWPPLATGWSNDETIAPGRTVLAGGAKRDAALWSGDMGIADPTEYVSTGDLTPVRNALDGLYSVQRPDGELPWAGPAIDDFGSDTYHTWTLVDTAMYYLDSMDSSWLAGIWPRYVAGMSYILGKVDAHGLLDVTDVADWARFDMGGENLEANAILYRALTLGTSLALARRQPALASKWAAVAAMIKTEVTARLWDPQAGAFRDNPTSSLFPQDGNSLAIWFGLVQSNGQSQAILARLQRNWNAYGAVTPEWSGISPFAGSMEVMARFVAGDATSGLALIRREWGYMLDAPIGSGSTFWEGMSDKGTLVFGGPYESLAHAWSTGPTAALTFYVAGLRPSPDGGRTFTVMPETGGLQHVEASLQLSPGRRISDSWVSAPTSFTLVVDSSKDPGATGTAVVPILGHEPRVTVNGRQVIHLRTEGSFAYVRLGAGHYTIVSARSQAGRSPAGSAESSQGAG